LVARVGGFCFGVIGFFNSFGGDTFLGYGFSEATSYLGDYFSIFFFCSFGGDG